MTIFAIVRAAGAKTSLSDRDPTPPSHVTRFHSMHDRIIHALEALATRLVTLRSAAALGAEARFLVAGLAALGLAGTATLPAVPQFGKAIAAVLERDGGAADRASTPPRPDRAPAGHPDWRRYRHPQNGATIWHPPGWRLQESAGGLMILPEQSRPQREVMLVFGDDAPGVRSATAAAVASRLDGMMRGMMPGMRRQGRPTAVDVAQGSAATFDYAGAMPNGTRARCRIWIGIHDGRAYGISLVADRRAFAERKDTLATMFASARLAGGGASAGGDTRGRAGRGSRDARVVGRFRGESIARSEGIYVNTQLVWAFNASGTFLYGAQSAMSASKRDYNGDLEWTATGTSAGSMKRGTWSTAGGLLTLRWSDGTRSVFAYGIEPNGALAVRNARTKKLINFYDRMR